MADILETFMMPDIRRAAFDIRADCQRERDGLLPGARFIPRNVLEWRLDPASSYRDDDCARLDRRLILICNEGFQSI